jgi:hypothetical protein
MTASLSDRSRSLRVLAQLNERDLLPLVRDVCRAHGVTLEELCGTLRSRSIHRARQEVWWRLRNHPGKHYSFGDLGRIFVRSADTIAEGVHAHAGRLAMPSYPKLASNVASDLQYTDPPATLGERILTLVRMGSYTSIRGIARALAATGGNSGRRRAVSAAMRAMIAEGRLSKVDKVFRAADP